MVQPERFDSRSPGWGKTNDPNSVKRPPEMLGPKIVARIEQREGLGGKRIGCRTAVRFERVAPSTGEPQIVAIVLSARRFGDEMLNFERDPEKPLRTETIAASLARVAPHLPSQSRRDVG